MAYLTKGILLLVVLPHVLDTYPQTAADQVLDTYPQTAADQVLDTYPQTADDQGTRTDQHIIELIRKLVELEKNDQELKSALHSTVNGDERTRARGDPYSHEKSGLNENKAHKDTLSTQSEKELLRKEFERSYGRRNDEHDDEVEEKEVEEKEEEDEEELPYNRARVRPAFLISGGRDRGKNKKNKKIHRMHGQGQALRQKNVDPNSALGRLLMDFQLDMNGVIMHPLNVDKQGLNRHIGDDMDHHPTPETPKEEESEEERGTLSLTRRNFQENYNFLWSDGVVPYEIESGAFSDEGEHIIERAIEEMNEKTCVYFRPKNVDDTDYVKFINVATGCWSYVGKIGGVQQIGLQSSGCLHNAIVLHEMCHAIGMQHEQSRTDRDHYISVLWDNVNGGQDNGNMRKSNTDDVNPYDYESILQYLLKDMSVNGDYTMRFTDPELEFLAGRSQKLTFYDIKDITEGYSCTDNCGSNTPVCQNGGFVDHTCDCICPGDLTGNDCSEILTDTGCGGVVDVTAGPQTIKTPNYPENYNVGAVCTWLVKGPPGEIIKLTINDLHLSYDVTNHNCFHWLEIRYNLIGQTGLKKCGEVSDKIYSTTWDGIPHLMYLQLDSSYADDIGPSKGFSLTVEHARPGCISSPCWSGTCVDDPDTDFKCVCDDLHEGVLCEMISAISSFYCDFENPDDCFFVNANDIDDVFDWTRRTGGTPSSSTGPSQAYGGQYYIYAEVSQRSSGDTATLVSNAILSGDGDWCLSFMYHMYGSDMGKLEVFGMEDDTVFWDNSENLGNQWNYVTVGISPEIDQRVGLKATVGRSFKGDVAIDNLRLRRCVRAECHFENEDDCFLAQSQSHLDDFDWETYQSGGTPSSGTGPTAAQDGNQYAYIEASNANPNTLAVLASVDSLPAGEYCLVFHYHMYGVKMGGLMVSAVLEASPNDEYPIFLKTGDQGQTWNTGVVSINEIDNFNLLFTAVRGSSYTSDVAIDNITLTSNMCGCLSGPCLNGGTCVDSNKGLLFQCSCPAGLSGDICEVVEADTELSCTFEDNTECFLQQAFGDSFDWTIQKGATATPQTGPSTAHEGTHYAYIETSGVVTVGYVANFTTFPIIFGDGDRCLSFYYHMNGYNVGSLAVYHGDTELFRESGRLGDQWSSTTIDVINMSATSQVIISARVDEPGESGDIAIDDVHFTPGAC
ncbi:uncharacterized protein [Argopecten irradians]|uniref:uncharacterized protein isoform X2 n=1 Tax=Argopecten irradians TaxID=31199 RepID=UPI003714174B